jgi:hypothetical protein
LKKRYIMHTQTTWLKSLKRTNSPFDVYTTVTPTNGVAAREYTEKRCSQKTVRPPNTKG